MIEDRTRRSRPRVVRRGRGRPPRDYSRDLDVEVAEWAIALQAAWDLSERKAIDLALAICRGEADPRSIIPAGTSVGYRLPQSRSFHSRSADIRLKLKTGKLRPNAEVTLAIARLLHRLRILK
jgi:hypothetical protein